MSIDFVSAIGYNNEIKNSKEFEEYIKDRQYIRESQINKLVYQMKGGDTQFKEFLSHQSDNLYENCINEIKNVKSRSLQRDPKIFLAQKNVHRQIVQLQGTINDSASMSQVMNMSPGASSSFQKLKPEQSQENKSFKLDKAYFQNETPLSKYSKPTLADVLQKTNALYNQYQGQDSDIFRQRPEFISQFKFQNFSSDISQKRQEIQKRLRKLKLQAGQQFDFQKYPLENDRNIYQQEEKVQQQEQKDNKVIDNMCNFPDFREQKQLIQLRESQMRNQTKDYLLSQEDLSDLKVLKNDQRFQNFINNNQKEQAYGRGNNNSNQIFQNNVSNQNILSSYQNLQQNLDYSQSIQYYNANNINNNSLDFSPFNSTTELPFKGKPSTNRRNSPYQSQKGNYLQYINSNRNTEMTPINNRSYEKQTNQRGSLSVQKYQKNQLTPGRNDMASLQKLSPSNSKFDGNFYNNSNNDKKYKIQENQLGGNSNSLQTQENQEDFDIEEDIEEDIPLNDNQSGLQEWMKNDEGVAQSYYQQSYEPTSTSYNRISRLQQQQQQQQQKQQFFKQF